MIDLPARTLSDPMTEKLLESLVALAAEVNVLRDRVATLEMSANRTSVPDSAERFVSSVFGGMATMAARPGADA
mgnify:CR=1 FL=1